jgi:hypothetical protein
MNWSKSRELCRRRGRHGSALGKKSKGVRIFRGQLGGILSYESSPTTNQTSALVRLERGMAVFLSGSLQTTCIDSSKADCRRR